MGQPLCNKMFLFMRNCYIKKIPMIPSIMRILIRVIFSTEIHPTCRIAENVQFIHNGLGCVFHENVVIESGVQIYQNVTLGGRGKKGTPKGTDHPIIRKNAVICAGACVLGPIIVGENAIVGANAVVLCDVPAGCTAIGVPAILKHNKEDQC